MAYDDPDFYDDETAAALAILADMALQNPGWEPADGSPEAMLAEAVGRPIASVLGQVRDEAAAAFAGVGERLLGLVRDPATFAEGTITVTAADADAHTLPAGSQLLLPAGSGEVVMFTTDAAMDFTSTAPQSVGITALQEGPEYNGKTGPARLVVDRAWIASLTVDAPTAGGDDEEDTESFLDKVADRFKRIRAVPITGQDFAAHATDAPFVGRALGQSLVDPEQPGVRATGHTMVWVMDVSGQSLDESQEAEVEERLNDLDTALNVTVHVGGPVRVGFGLHVAFWVIPGADPDYVSEQVEIALRAFTDPALQGLDRSLGGKWAALRLAELSVFDLAEIVGAVAGVDRVQSVAFEDVTGADTVTDTAIVQDHPATVYDLAAVDLTVLS